MEVSVRTFSMNPSQYIARARKGEDVIVTVWDMPAVRLVPIQTQSPTVAEQLQNLSKLAGAKVPQSKPSIQIVKVTLKGEGPLASEMLLEDRR